MTEPTSSIVAKRPKLPPISTVLFYLFMFGVAVACIRYFGSIREDIGLFVKIQPVWLLAAVAFQVGTYVAAAASYRQWIIAYGHPNIVRMPEMLELSVMMLFFNQTVPSAGVSGGAFLSRRLMRRGISPEKSVSIFLLELLAQYLALLACALGLLMFGGALQVPAFAFGVLITGIIAYTFLICFVLLLGRRSTLNFVLSRLDRIPFMRKRLHRFEGLAKAESGDVRGAVRMFLANPDVSSQAVLLAVIVITFDMLTIWALFAGLGVPVGLGASAAGYILTRIITSIPTSPGSLVVFEGGMAYFLSGMGVPLEAAVTITLLFRILSFWLPMPVGFFLYRRMQRRDRSEAARAAAA